MRFAADCCRRAANIGGLFELCVTRAACGLRHTEYARILAQSSANLSGTPGADIELVERRC
jgi:hypothetical protein